MSKVQNWEVTDRYRHEGRILAGSDIGQILATGIPYRNDLGEISVRYRSYIGMNLADIGVMLVYTWIHAVSNICYILVNIGVCGPGWVPGLAKD